MPHTTAAHLHLWDQVRSIKKKKFIFIAIFLQFIYYSTFQDGRVVDTPEVAQAKAVHFSLYSAEAQKAAAAGPGPAPYPGGPGPYPGGPGPYPGGPYNDGSYNPAHDYY